VINARASKEKQELLHDLYRFIFADPFDCWAATAPFTLARNSGRRDAPTVRGFPDVDKITTATDNRIFLPRTLVFNELADAMHRAVQKVLLGNADIKASSRSGGRSRSCDRQLQRLKGRRAFAASGRLGKNGNERAAWQYIRRQFGRER